MADEHIELNPDAFVSAQEIDDIVSQFRLFNRRLSQQQIQKLFSELPKLTETDLAASGHRDDVCPICFNTFLAILAEEEVAQAMDSPAHPVDELGVTRLQNTCGHMFCRKELGVVQPSPMKHTNRTLSIMKWITEGHDSCPSCRQLLITDEQRQEARVFPHPGETWPPPWLVNPRMVAREDGLPPQLPTLSFDSIHTTRHQLAGMYS